MAGAVDNSNEPQIGHVLAHARDQVDPREEAENRVKAAGDKGRRLLDPAVLDLRLLGEVELGRAVTVEWSAKATPCEFPGVIVEVVRREPIWQRVRVHQTVEVFRVGRLGRSGRRLPAFARSRIVDFPQGSAHVGLEFGLRDTRLLEIELIEEPVLVDVSKQLDAVDRASSGMGGAQRGDSPNPLRKEQRSVPDNGGPPIVADQNCLPLAETFDKPRDVGAQLLDRIGLDRGWLVAAAIATDIRRGDAIARFSKGRDLMPPGVPALRPAVHQNDQRSLSREGHPQPNAVGLNRGKFRLYGHDVSSGVRGGRARTITRKIDRREPFSKTGGHASLLSRDRAPRVKSKS